MSRSEVPRAIVWRDRSEVAALVNYFVPHLAVQAARRGEEEAADPRLLGLRGHSYRGEVVHVVRGVRVELAHRIVTDSSKVQDCVEADQVLGFDIGDVLRLGWHFDRGLTNTHVANMSESSPTTSWRACSSMGTKTEPT
jgi:hypothetical protein